MLKNRGGVIVKEFYKPLIIFSFLFVLLMGSFVVGDIYRGNITFDLPTNVSYSNTADVNFRINITDGGSGSYDAELFITNSSGTFGAGVTNILNGTRYNLTSNYTLQDYVNYTVYINVSNATVSNVTDSTTFTVDTTYPVFTWDTNTTNILRQDNFSGQTGSAIVLNLTFVDATSGNISIILQNISNGTQIDVLNTTKANVTSAYGVNYSNLSDGRYRLNFTCRWILCYHSNYVR